MCLTNYCRWERKARRDQGWSGQSLQHKQQAQEADRLLVSVYLCSVGARVGRSRHKKEGLYSQSIRMTEKTKMISKPFLLNLTNDAVQSFRIRTICYPFLYLPHHRALYAERIFHRYLMTK